MLSRSGVVGVSPCWAALAAPERLRHSTSDPSYLPGPVTAAWLLLCRTSRVEENKYKGWTSGAEHKPVVQV